MHRVLRDDGSFYLHLDSTAQAYGKALLDSIFGPKNFQNEIVWKRTTAHSDSKRFGANTDRLLFYTKGRSWTWNPQYEPYDEAYKARFRNSDPDGRRWSDYDITAKGLSGGGYEYEYKGITSYWRVPLETMERLDAEGRLHFTSNGGIRRKRYLDEMKGRPIQALWTDIEPINSQAKERTGFPTQKPLSLYERIILASSNPGDMVLDPFCGCATTPVAAERQKRQWVGIDVWDAAYQTVLDRLQEENLAVPGGRRRRGQQTLTFNDIHYQTVPPTRTDDDEIPVPNLRLRIQRPKEPWERLTNRQMRDILTKAQEVNGKVGCAGCGRVLEREFMELDHIQPKAEGGADHLLNRILLCGPCNGRKSNTLTMAGLRRENRRADWMENANLSQQIQDRAMLRATIVRDDWGKPGLLDAD